MSDEAKVGRVSAAQRRVVEAVRAGAMTQAWTGSIDGNIVRRLIRSGILIAAHTVLQKAERTHWGRRIPQCVNYIGLRVAD